MIWDMFPALWCVALCVVCEALPAAAASTRLVSKWSCDTRLTAVLVAQG
jgi:hypothetical protein